MLSYIVYHMQVTTELLVSTQAGKKLRKFTKHSNAAVAQAAAAAVAAWKTAVTQEAGVAHNGSAAEGKAIPVYCDVGDIFPQHVIFTCVHALFTAAYSSSSSPFNVDDRLLSKHAALEGMVTVVQTQCTDNPGMVLPCNRFTSISCGCLSADALPTGACCLLTAQQHRDAC